MASQREVQAMLRIMAEEGVLVVPNPAVNHHFLTVLDDGALQVRTVNGAVRANTHFGETQVEYTVCVTRAVEAGIPQRTAVVSATVRVWPQDEQFESKDIFDDEWVIIGRTVHIALHGWMWVVAKLLCGVLTNVNEYADGGDSNLSDPLEF